MVTELVGVVECVEVIVGTTDVPVLEGVGVDVEAEALATGGAVCVLVMVEAGVGVVCGQGSLYRKISVPPGY